MLWHHPLLRLTLEPRGTTPAAPTCRAQPRWQVFSNSPCYLAPLRHRKLLPCIEAGGVFHPWPCPHLVPHGSPQLLKRTGLFPCCPLGRLPPLSSCASRSPGALKIGSRFLGAVCLALPAPPAAPARSGPAEDVVPSQPRHGLGIFFPRSLLNLPEFPPGLPLVSATPASFLSWATAMSGFLYSCASLPQHCAKQHRRKVCNICIADFERFACLFLPPSHTTPLTATLQPPSLISPTGSSFLGPQGLRVGCFSPPPPRLVSFESSFLETKVHACCVNVLLTTACLPHFADCF